nr:MAG TPA: hypothetical protein [Caudoviricetes sp.]
MTSDPGNRSEVERLRGCGASQAPLPRASNPGATLRPKHTCKIALNKTASCKLQAAVSCGEAKTPLQFRGAANPTLHLDK